MTKPYRQAIMAIILNEDKKFLIGNSPRDGGFKFPQGGLDENEDPRDCLVRELFEELGIVLEIKDIMHQLATTVMYDYPSYKPYSEIFKGQEMYVFIIKYHNDMQPTPQDEEFDQLYWIDQHELNQFDFSYRKIAYEKAIEEMMKLIHQIT